MTWFFDVVAYWFLPGDLGVHVTVDEVLADLEYGRS